MKKILIISLLFFTNLSANDFKLDRVIKGFGSPWSLTFIDNTNLFITEKKGLNKIRNFLKESGVKDIAENMASIFFKEAMLCLEKIENVNKLELQNFLDFIKIRGR